MKTPLLEISNVSKIYKMDGLNFQALDDVSLTIKIGEFVAIMGPSGSGKKKRKILLMKLSRQRLLHLLML